MALKSVMKAVWWLGPIHWRQLCRCVESQPVRSGWPPALLLACLFAGPAFGQSVATAEPQHQCPDPLSTMLWEVRDQRPGSNPVSVYLFGSIHVGKPSMYPLAPVVENRFRNAGHLVFEIDPRSAADAQTALQMQLRGMLPAGRQLDEVVSERTLADLSRVLDSLQIPLENLSAFKPWMITLLLANLQVNNLGFEAEWGLESYFMAQRNETSEILQLESIESQVGMLESLDQDAFLGYSLREYEQGSMLFEALMEAWQCGDVERLAEVMFSTDSTSELTEPEAARSLILQEQLYSRRNKVMADGIDGYLRTGQGGYFVVVGAGHLLGENSVPDLLAERGYRVTSVRKSLESGNGSP